MRLKFSQFFVVLLMIGALTLGGCTSGTASSSPSPDASESVPGIKDLPRLEGKATVVMTVNSEPIEIEVDGTMHQLLLVISSIWYKKAFMMVWYSIGLCVNRNLL